jgi:ADP-heptose:LPS heptosyltransferase
LQKEIRDGEDAELARLPSIAHFEEDIDDLADTAALIELCDFVISVDTAQAHVAGALAKPVWLLLPFAPDWRWLLDREDSPWYPSARLFRQQQPGDWESVIVRVKRELQVCLRVYRPESA